MEMRRSDAIWLLFVDEENLLDADAILPAMMVKEPASP
jgi:hypothetical protein